jgi:tetraacyldisaccharide 4'-kinase
MAGHEPWWWYQSEPAWPARLLTPLARLYGAVTAQRMLRRDGHRSSCPVICIGNFTAGGTGKTPTTRALASYLRTRGARPAILSRGYGGRTRGPHWVDPQRDRAELVGDEPLLLAAVAPTLVARDRAAGARAIEAAGNTTHILLDDGLQNPALQPTRRIAVVDARRGVGNGRVIPAGPLRADLVLQAGLVDAIVLNHGYVAGALPDAPIAARLRAMTDVPIVSARLGLSEPGDWLAGARVIAFAGIGVPGHFFRMLADLGANVIAAHSFGDHQPVGADRAEALLAQAAREQAQLVTTEKDQARLTGGVGAVGRLAAAARCVPVTLVFEHENVVGTLLGAA